MRQGSCERVRYLRYQFVAHAKTPRLPAACSCLCMATVCMLHVCALRAFVLCALYKGNHAHVCETSCMCQTFFFCVCVCVCVCVCAYRWLCMSKVYKGNNDLDNYQESLVRALELQKQLIIKLRGTQPTLCVCVCVCARARTHAHERTRLSVRPCSPHPHKLQRGNEHKTAIHARVKRVCVCVCVCVCVYRGAPRDHPICQDQGSRDLQ